MNELTTERLNEIIADTGRPKMHWADCTERYRMALELKAKREECEALQRERDESRDLIASAMHDVGERSFLEDAQRILQGCVAPYSCEQMKSVADALRQWRDKWAILLETLVRSNEERDAAREACERKHQDGWAWQQLSQQREAERDAARAEAEKLRIESQANADTLGDWRRKAEFLLQEREQGIAARETLDDVCKALGADVDSAVPQALMFKEKAGEAEKLRAALIACGRNAGGGMADSVSTEFLMHVPEQVRLHVEKLRAELQAMTVEAMRAGREASELRADLCEIAEGTGCNVPDRAEAKRRIIALAAEAEKLRASLREANQTLVACIGADGPDTAEEAAKRAVEEIVNLRAELDAIRGRDAEPFDWDGVPTVEEWIAENLRVREPRAGSAMVELHPDEVVADRGESRRVAGWLKDLLAELAAVKQQRDELVGRIKKWSESDWPEDATDENGLYSCWCAVCRASFTGHKHRVLCRRCAASQPAQQPKPEVQP